MTLSNLKQLKELNENKDEFNKFSKNYIIIKPVIPIKSGEDITEKGFANHRRNHVSFIFQAYNLIDYMTPLENVKLTSKLPPEPVLEKMGLTKEEMKRNVLQLSGGQQQRVAIARALASEAPVILADVN